MPPSGPVPPLRQSHRRPRPPRMKRRRNRRTRQRQPKQLGAGPQAAVRRPLWARRKEERLPGAMRS
eukprot:11009175-Lingulodinium_polyedra.AAC.1